MRTFTRTSAMLFALMYGISVTGAATAVSALPLADKHEHKEGENHKHEEPKGERHELGSAEIGGFTVAVTQVGEAKPGEPALFIAKVSGGKGEPKAVRAWAASNKIEIPARGRIPAAVIEQYRAAGN